MKEILAGFVFIMVLAGGIFAIQSFDFGSYKFWAPKYEDARREVFENTKSYRDGSRRDLDKV